MIEINLLPGKKKRRRAAAPISMDAISQRVKDPLLVGAVGIWAVVLLAVAGIFVTQTAKQKGLQGQVDEVRAEAQHFRSVIGERREQQRLHDVLVAEFDAIRGIDSERYVWSHVLQEVTQALPDYTWIVGLEFVPAAPQSAPAEDESAEPVPEVKPPIKFTINGRTSDIGAYTRFLRRLGESPWLTEIVPGATSTLVEDERPIIAFVITATYQEADSAFINVSALEEVTR